MPNITDEEAADYVISAINNTFLTQKQLAALSYIQENILSQIHQEHCFIDVQRAFQAYDALYFRGMLVGKVDVGWSGRMTVCAGTCQLRSARNDGKRSTWPEGITVRIKLSEPILKFRTNIDVLNTLIHEMIHAYLFTVGGKHVRADDPSGHGVGFLTIANAINKKSQSFYSITVFHNFHDEVDHYRTHLWQCTGPCTAKPPFFGVVKRAMNRPPGPSDNWYRQHQETCGGEFIKIAGPPEKVKESAPKNKISGWLKTSESKNDDKGQEGVEKNSKDPQVPPVPPVPPVASSSGTQGRKRRRDTADEGRMWGNGWGNSQAIGIDDGDDDVVMTGGEGSNSMVVCPICFDKVWEASINHHLDNEHSL